MKDIVNSLVQLVNGANAVQEQAQLVLTSRESQRKAVSYTSQRSVKSINTKFSGSKTTKTVRPEDVIPLEDDSQGF